MENKNYTNIIPENQEGGVINTESVKELSDVRTAVTLYETAKNKLLDVNHWHHVAGEALANFQLTNQSGQGVSGPVREGLFFKINVPGPGNEAGEGYDWVQVEEVKEYTSDDIASIGIRVRPCANPTTEDTETAHFYSSESTSTFTVTREKTKVTAAVYDRNTKPNSDSEGIVDKIRNLFTGVAGRLIFSKIQWKSLTDGLVKSNN